MEQALIRKIKAGTLDAYRAYAASKGSSVEAELRKLIEANAPQRPKDSKKLMKMSDEALAMTPPDGPDGASDSTLLIRWDRDTNHGRDINDGWHDDDAGR